MANYCSSCFALSGRNRRETLQIYFMLYGLDKVDIWRFLDKELRIPAEKIERADGRTSVDLLGLDTGKKSKKLYVMMSTESAWGPCYDFVSLIKTKCEENLGMKDNEEIDIVYIAEEPGTELYINTDADRDIFVDEVVVEYGYDNEYYTKEDFPILQEFIKKITGVTVEDLEDLTEEKINKIIKIYESERKEDEDSFLAIHRFTL